ncbi:lycopene cyclase domain-containing protein [Mangrovimonas spongiae]|uniref:Lycopene cyclase domain-containing protein n=1 Tax=Mangrovimonas spongiae TaxID=2494697 RepID=A0A3R9PJQ8_9FLAO|nr:lycopene cyclase domain-containing protein [Mangrovimonas spongiae]RSK39828.1 lycopene cyclase domain-containing protein [Mangrovimonas spongiae]
MQSYTYLLVNLCCIAIPLIASFYPKHAFYKDWIAFFKGNIITAIIFIIWDTIFTKMGVWGFNPTYLTGISIGNLPIEEILFFICIPFACVFTYFALKYLIKQNPLEKIQHVLTFALITILLLIAIFNYNKLYTFVTCLSTSLYLSYLTVKKVDLSYYYLSYLLVLPFFYLSNGILTGSFFIDPIVWYNDAENLGVRISNIPIEDSIYGLLLIFMNIHLYKYFKTKSLLKIK